VARDIKGLLIYGLTLVIIASSIVLPSMLAFWIADLAGCKMEVAAYSPCMKVGFDIGKFIFFLPLISFFTGPAGIVALSIWLLMFVFHLIMMWVKHRERKKPPPSGSGLNM
jgi:hypothetical protein